nr:hypothetical protein [Microcystis aeruginosa]
MESISVIRSKSRLAYLIFREKVPEFSPLSPQWLALFEGKKVQKSYPTRFLDLFSQPYLNRLY